MKIIHCADLHLDAKMESRLTSDQAKQRREELLYTWERMVSWGAEHDVSVILIAGDLFDTRRVRRTARRRVLQTMAAYPQMDFVYLRGNHDDTELWEGEASEIPSNLKRFSETEWTSYDYGEAVISGIEITKENKDTYAARLLLDPSRCNIVTLHGQEGDYAGKDDTCPVLLPPLRNAGIDYLALGHVHSYRRERLDERGVWCYAGCLEGRGFDECGEKGFVLLEVSDGKVTDTFVPFAGRSLYEETLEVSPEEDMPRLLARAEELLSHRSPRDLVRLVLTGRTSMEEPLEPARFQERFEGRFFYFAVKDTTRVAVDYARYAQDPSLKGEFVRLLEDADLPEEERAAVIALGIAALSGEEWELP